VLDEKSLEKKANNFIVSLIHEKDTLAFTVADISTGYFSTMETQTDKIEQVISDEFARLQPTECIISEELYNNQTMLRILNKEKKINIFPFTDWHLFAMDATNVLKKHFGVSTLAAFDLETKPLAQQSAAALLGYLQQTQKGPVNHIRKISSYATHDYLVLDRSTMINLELFATIRDREEKGTLLSVMDKTMTAMGGRLLKHWMRYPLFDMQKLQERHDCVAELLQKQKERYLLREKIQKINDIERLVSRLSVGLGNARDLINLKESLRLCREVKKDIEHFTNKLMQTLATELQESITEIIAIIEATIVPEPPISIREGRMIHERVNKELDKLRGIVSGSRDWLIELEQQERIKTGITSLKIRYNQVFGFYIEISKANLANVPDTYMRKQTLVNAERFITKELKEQEEIILTAEERINAIEYALFQETVEKVLAYMTVIQETASHIAHIDCLLNFAHIAEHNHYIRATMDDSGSFIIKGGRHPVVETLLEERQFVPNDVSFDNDSQQLLIITGPNMAGKSVFIRQNALIVLMNQMGSFVPVEQAALPLVDQIFVRSGASDVITSGLSTFMVEMVETAHILHHATKRSFIVMDEIGRGTSTYDGISIAWAVAEHLVKKKNETPKTLFATHYHELQVLEEKYPNQIRNYHMSVINDADEPIFLHTLLPGGASHSFGVAVAKLAGIPDEVILRANELLGELEQRDGGKTEKQRQDGETGLNPVEKDNETMNDVISHLKKLDISNMTPLEALNILAELKEKL
jgi:DNA mismatch repair protein MutS